MSHITEIRCKIYDLQSLKKAIEKLGGVFHENKHSYRGYYSTHVCNHAASFGASRFELGIVKSGNEYSLKYDVMLENIIGKDATKLMDIYNMEKSRYEAEMMGYMVSEEYMEKDGTRVMEIIVEGY